MYFKVLKNRMGGITVLDGKNMSASCSTENGKFTVQEGCDDLDVCTLIERAYNVHKASSEAHKLLSVTLDNNAPDGSIITIGRAPDNDIVIDAHTISRHHGVFLKMDGEWFYRDTSSNGTMVRGWVIFDQIVSVGRNEWITVADAASIHTN